MSKRNGRKPNGAPNTAGRRALALSGNAGAAQGEKMPWPRPVVGVPLERTLAHADKVIWPLLAIAAQGFPFITLNYGRTDLVRNRMAQQLLGSHFTHLVMLDSDHIHPTDIVQRLMQNFIEHPELKVVGGLNFRRGEPFEPCCFVRGDDGVFYSIADWVRGSVMKVDAIGTGTIAIAREVFELMEPPWFFNPYDKVMDDVWPGEDIGFSEKCRELGIDLFVDTRITSPHLMDSVVDEQSFMIYKQEMGLGQIPVEDVIAEAKDASTAPEPQPSSGTPGLLSAMEEQ